MKRINFIALLLILISFRLCFSETVDISQLPLIEAKPQKWCGGYLAVLVSGDGGWARSVKAISRQLNEQGIGVICLNSQKYFWKKRTPEETGQALLTILDHYLKAWKKEQAVLIGYSRGAGVLPFMINRLPPALRDKIIFIALLGPDKDEDFEIHLLEFLGASYHKNALPVLPEVRQLKGKKILCICGDEEKESLCHDLKPDLAKTVQIKGDHHLGYQFAAVAQLIIKEVEAK